MAISVNVGADATITYGDTLTLNAVVSGNSGAVTHAWTIPTKPSGAAAALSSTTSATPTIRPDKPGTWTFTDTATDTVGSASDSITITVQAQMWVRVSGTGKPAQRRIRKAGVVA